jgi:hypothetical protein
MMHNTLLIEEICDKLLSCFELGELASAVRTKVISKLMTGPLFRNCSNIPTFHRR